MNAHTARALLDDAFFQVLDNKVFRLLIFLALALVAPTFLIGFHEHEVSILFGWKVLSYSDLLSAVGQHPPDVKDLHVGVIQGVQSLVIEKLAGTFGITFCIAATAFFVPRMLEKGAADTVFSKPVSRLALLVARYLSGLLFVGVLATLLVVGMHVGLLVTSGYSDPGFLWGALTLLYIFALIHAFSTCVAAFTRSSVAAILATLMLFMFNGCVQSIWVLSQYHAEQESLKRESDGNTTPPADDVLFLTLFRVGLNTAHYVLPKTNDADILTRKLRIAVTRQAPVVRDKEGNLLVAKSPEDFELVSGGGEDADLAETHAVWIAKDSRGAEKARIELSRRSRVLEKPGGDKDAPKPGAKPGVRKQYAGMAADEYRKSLTGHPEVAVPPVRSRTTLGSLGGEMIAWTEKRGEQSVTRQHVFATAGDWMFELDVAADSDWFAEERHDDHITEFFARFSLAGGDARSLEPPEWYSRQLSWNAPIKYNIFFSVASSLLFCAAMLGLAWWKISRIDF
jgi:ABC-type transport system involved in multi-copper enzyme maturation permease subunit